MTPGSDIPPEPSSPPAARRGTDPNFDMPYPPNPDYGNGRTTRRVRLTVAADFVTVEMTDIYHHMRVSLKHDGHSVLTIDGEMERHPTTGCPGAITILRELEGIRLGTPAVDLYKQFETRRHCTHLFDLAMIGIANATDGPKRVAFKAIVPDELDEPVWLSITKNSALVHRWRVQGSIIVEPSHLAGRPLMAGFARWASKEFATAEFEAALILERTWFIARGRPYLHDGMVGASITINENLRGSCFAYDPGKWENNYLQQGYVSADPTFET